MWRNVCSHTNLNASEFRSMYRTARCSLYFSYLWNNVDKKIEEKQKMLNLITAIPEAPFSSRFGRRAGKTAGSFWELSKFGTKSTCKKLSEEQRIYWKEWNKSTWEVILTVSWSKSASNMASVSACGEITYPLFSVNIQQIWLYFWSYVLYMKNSICGCLKIMKRFPMVREDALGKHFCFAGCTRYLYSP